MPRGNGRRPRKACVEGLEDGLMGLSFGWENVSARWLRAYAAGVVRGKEWRAHIQADKFGWPQPVPTEPLQGGGTDG